MTWDDLRFIYTVSKAGSMSAAAKILEVNVTTVSRRLRSIEENSNVRIFEKLREGVVLTSAGEEIFRVSEKIDDLASELSAKVSGLEKKLSGNIRITTMDTLLSLWMKDISGFKNIYPEINLEFTSSYSLSNLSKRDADIAIRMTPKAPLHLIGRKHAEVFFAIYGSKKLIKKIGENKSYSDFPWISWDSSVGRATDNYIEKSARGAKIVMRIDRMDILIRSIQESIGISILPCFAGDTAKGLVRIGNYFEGGTYLWVLTHPDIKSSAKIIAFNKFIKEIIEKDLDLIEGNRPQL